MPNRYANLVGSNKISDEFTKINTGFDTVQTEMDTEVSNRQQLETRVDTILNNPDGTKDAELVDIRTPDASYTPAGTISVAGDLTRDMQARQVAHENDYATNAIKKDGSVPMAADLDMGNFALKNASVVAAGTNAPPAGRVVYFITGNGTYEQLNTGINFVTTITNAQTQLLLTDADNSNIRYILECLGAGGTIKALQVASNGYVYINSILIVTKPGSPEGSVTAPVGSLCLRTDGGAGTTLYVKESGTGNTGWVAK